jgi:hypothetical protein
LRILRDVIVFQVKCGLEAVLDVTLIPISLGAALLDLVFGNWRRPHLFHAVLRLGERCEGWIDLWGVAPVDTEAPPGGVDAVLRNLETVLRNPRTGPESVRTLRRWAALKLVGDDTAQLQPPARKEDGG